MYQSANCHSTVADLLYLVISCIIFHHYLWWMHDITSSSVTGVGRFYLMSWNIAPNMFTCSVSSPVPLSASCASLLSSYSWALCLSICSHFAPYPCRPSQVQRFFYFFADHLGLYLLCIIETALCWQAHRKAHGVRHHTKEQHKVLPALSWKRSPSLQVSGSRMLTSSVSVLLLQVGDASLTTSATSFMLLTRDTWLAPAVLTTPDLWWSWPVICFLHSHARQVNVTRLLLPADFYILHLWLDHLTCHQISIHTGTVDLWYKQAINGTNSRVRLRVLGFFDDLPISQAPNGCANSTGNG